MKKPQTHVCMYIKLYQQNHNSSEAYDYGRPDEIKKLTDLHRTYLPSSCDWLHSLRWLPDLHTERMGHPAASLLSLLRLPRLSCHVSRDSAFYSNGANCLSGAAHSAYTVIGTQQWWSESINQPCYRKESNSCVSVFLHNRPGDAFKVLRVFVTLLHN